MPGSIRDVSSLTNSIVESRLKDVIVVTDKGFYSENNITHFENAELDYIVPVRRDLCFIVYYKEEELKDFFCFRKRIIWYKEYEHENRRIIYFLDKGLKVEEENSFLQLVSQDKRKKEEYEKRKLTFGTITVMTSTKLSPQKVYGLLKERVDIEQAFDTFKNTLESDKTYMRSEEAMRGYFFISFLALYLHCKIMVHLREKDMLSKVSVNDALIHLSKIYKIRINDKEMTSEIPKQTKLILDKLSLPIT